MGLRDALATPGPPERTHVPPDLPKGWEPGVRWSNSTDSGTITTDATTTEPDAAVWRELVADWGLDPETMEIVDGSIELIGWDSPVKATTTGEKIRLKRYRARLRRRTGAEDTADVAELCKRAERRKPPRSVVDVDAAGRALVVALSDWQVGKGEGDGTAGTVDRIIASVGALTNRLRELKRLKRPVGVVYLVGLGDIVEQCTGHYPSQEFTTDLNRREQMRVARRLILRYVDAVVDAGYPLVLTGVAGNHGENRRDGKAFTDPTDNDDLAVLEQVAEVLAANPDRYASVSTFLPSTLSMALDVCGVPVGFTHGHVARGGSHPVSKIENWWTGQVMGMQPVADARILVTGHYHHLIVSESTGRTHFQCPAMDPGSQWWTQSTGQSSPPGVLTFVVDSAAARGWCDMELL